MTPQEITDEKIGDNRFLKYIVVFLLSVIVFPSILTGTICYWIFFKILKWRAKYITIAYSIIVIPVYLIYFVIYKSTHSQFTPIQAYIFIDVLLGIIGSWLWIIWRNSQLKRFPELKVMQGWSYEYKHKDSPFETHKKKRLIHDCQEGLLYSEEGSPIGILQEPVELAMGETHEGIELVDRRYDEAKKTTFVMGTTGSGKSVTIIQLIKNDVENNIPICVIDFKKSMEFAYHLSKIAKENNRLFYHFINGRQGTYQNPFCSHQATYDPLSGTNATAKADTVLNMREWDASASVYQNTTKALLQTIFYLLANVDKSKVPHINWNEGGISQFADALSLPNLKSLFNEYQKSINYRRDKGKVTSEEERKLRELQDLISSMEAGRTDPYREQIRGLQSTFKNLLLSTYSTWLMEGNSPYHINLEQAFTNTENPPIILFQFSELEEQEFARTLGNILIQDIMRVSAIKEATGKRNMVGLYIDEYQTLNPITVASMVAKIRASNIFTTLSCQSLSQIAQAGNGQSTVKATLGSIGNFIIHNGVVEDEAIEIAGILGKTQKTFYRSNGRRDSDFFSFNWNLARKSIMTSSTKEEYIVSPSSFQSLVANPSTGHFEAYYITKSCTNPIYKDIAHVIARKVMLVPDKAVLEQVPEDFKQTFNEKRLLDIVPSYEEVVPELTDDNFTVEPTHRTRPKSFRDRKVTVTTQRKENHNTKENTQTIQERKVTSFEKMMKKR